MKLKTNKDRTTKVKDDSVQSAFVITKINGFPPEIEGCSCYFSESLEDFKNKKYIYVDDYANSAYISVNNKLIQLNLNNLSENDYTVDLVKSSSKSNGDETTWQTGVIRVKSKIGKVVEKKFVGECGC